MLVFASGSAHAEVASPAPPTDEGARIAACGGRVSRSGDTLHLAVTKGAPVVLKDEIKEEPEAFVHDEYELAECADDLGLFIVHIKHYESTTQILIDQIYGERFKVAGPIHISPSKQAIVVVEPFGSGGEFSDYGINFFHRRPDGAWNERWQYRPTDFHGREFVAWEGEDAVRISTATWNGPRVTGHETVLRVSPLQFIREDGPEKILRDEKGRYVDHIPGEQ